MDEQRADTTPYGDVQYADPGYQDDKVKRYPIDTEAHVRAAWSYINQERNASQYTAEQLAAIKGRIRAAAKRFGIQISDDSSRSAGGLAEQRDTPGIVEVRAGGIGGHTISGYAAVYNRPSKNLGGFVEQVRDTAFAESRGRGWHGVVSEFNHDRNMLLGTTAAHTLRLSHDQTGLSYEVQPPQSRGDVVDLVQRGDVQHSSFSFLAIEDEWGQSEQGYPQRSLIKVKLFSTEPVTTPAYPDTTAAMRSLAMAVGAELGEVIERAVANELRGFFVRTDVEGQPKPRKFGTALLVQHMGTKRDPWA